MSKTEIVPQIVPRHLVPDHEKTSMIIPVSKQTFFNTNWKNDPPLCAYDMIYHPPDYNPKAPRSDRLDIKIIRKRIWEQELHKGISSTAHFMLGRPKWKILDPPTKEHVRVQVKSENPHMRLYNIIQWAVTINEGKPSICDQ